MNGTQAFGDREIMDIKAAANYLGVSRSHLSHILAGKVAGVPAIPHVRAGRRVIRRAVIDRWLLEQEHSVDASGGARMTGAIRPPTVAEYEGPGDCREAA